MSKSTSSTGSRRVRRKPAVRAGLSAITVLAASAMLMIAAGLGAAAAFSASPAGASTANTSLPPVNVSVQNTPTVNVGNLPINSAGRLRVQNGIGTNEVYQFGGGVWGYQVTAVCSSCQPNVITLANISGPGLFYGMAWWATQTDCSAFDGVTNLIVDGHYLLNNAWSNYAWPNNVGGADVNNNMFFGGPGSPLGGQLAACSSPAGHYYPPTPIPFQHSLVVQMYPAPWWNQPGAQIYLGGEGWYSVGNSP